MLEHADLGEDLGQVEFSSGTIRLSRELAGGEFRSTLTHEAVHLLRGPVPEQRRPLEEVLVEQKTAEILIPERSDLAARDRRWTDSEVTRLAVRYDVDETLMYEAIEPTTRPLPVIPPPRPASEA